MNNSLVVNKDAIFPELVSSGITKWYLLLYDDFFDQSFIERLCLWGQEINSYKITIDIFRSFGRDDFEMYSKQCIDFSKKSIDFFFETLTLDKQPRELFLEAAFIINEKKQFVIYLDKGCEIALIGVTDANLLEGFELVAKPYLESSLVERFNFLYNNTFRSSPNKKDLIIQFKTNYFDKEIVLNQ